MYTLNKVRSLKKSKEKWVFIYKLKLSDCSYTVNVVLWSNPWYYPFQNRRPDLTKKLDELQGLLELQAQEYPQKLCQPDKPASPCCEYLETLKGNSRSESAIRLNEKRDGLKCWPGIAFCKKNVRSRQVLPAQNRRRSMPSAVKCRPGVSACRKGKRTLPKVFARSVQCVPGFPWCGWTTWPKDA